jgi:hypothetical protein
MTAIVVTMLETALNAVLSVLMNGLTDCASNARIVAAVFAPMVAPITSDDLLAQAYASKTYQDWVASRINLLDAQSENAGYLGVYLLSVHESLITQAMGHAGALLVAEREFDKYLSVFGATLTYAPTNRTGSVQTRTAGQTARSDNHNTVKTQSGGISLGQGSGRGGNHLQSGLTYVAKETTMQRNWALTCKPDSMRLANSVLHVGNERSLSLVADKSGNLKPDCTRVWRELLVFQCCVMIELAPETERGSWLGRINSKLPEPRWTADMTSADVETMIHSVSLHGYNGYVDHGIDNTVVVEYLP